MNYWRVHMKSGMTLDFDKRARYVDTLNGTNCVAMMSSKHGCVLAMIPTDNIYWIEAIEEDDDQEVSDEEE